MESRRKFIRHSSLAVAGSLMVPNFLKSLDNSSKNTDNRKILVIIQLSGGNDGLNTIIPYRNDLYYQNRPQLAVPRTNVLQASDELGFHPALSRLNDLYDKGYLSVINNVGYPNPDRSHFRAMDIWHTASNSEEYWNTGWIGRYLDSSCQNCPADKHVAHHAVEIDDSLSLALKGESIKGLAMKNPNRLRQILNNEFFQNLHHHHLADPVDDPALHYLYKTLAETTSSADYIYNTSKRYLSNGVYPDFELSKQLKTIAELIISGLETKVYYVSFPGFDTHVRQQPVHERLLTIYAESVHSFIADLEKNNRFDDVMVMTFSEFGRRVAQNGSAGTDHGTANNLFILGKNLKQKGFFNPSPDLAKLEDGDLIHQIDFRSIYTTLLNKWLHTTNPAILKSKFELLDFI